MSIRRRHELQELVRAGGNWHTVRTQSKANLRDRTADAEDAEEDEDEDDGHHGQQTHRHTDTYSRAEQSRVQQMSVCSVEAFPPRKRVPLRPAPNNPNNPNILHDDNGQRQSDALEAGAAEGAEEAEADDEREHQRRPRS